MFIVIEGTDASGKTSLIEAIDAEIRSRYPSSDLQKFHKGRPGEETRRWVLNDYVTSIESVDWTRNNALSDRWHWGEITYAPLKRPHTNSDGYGLLGRAGWRWTELFMKSRGISQFWLYQPLDVIQSRLSSRGDDFVNVNELSGILDQYNAAAVVSNLTDILKPEADSLDGIADLARRVVDTASLNSERVKKLVSFPEYIGSLEPEVLLVGDCRNIVKKYGVETHLPFMPVDGNSGEFLLTALPSEFWKTVGIVNVNDMNGSFSALHTALNSPTTIALGRLAAKGMESQGVTPDVVLPHPQYVRRFHNRDKTEYGEAIKRNTTNPNKEDKWALR